MTGEDGNECDHDDDADGYQYFFGIHSKYFLTHYLRVDSVYHDTAFFETVFQYFV